MGNLLEWIAKASQPVEQNLVEAAGPVTKKVASPVEERPILRHRDSEMDSDSGLARVKGTMKSFECIAGGGYRLHLQMTSKEMVFTMPDPKDIVVRNTANGMIEWSCGPLKPQELTVVYKASVERKADGVVAELIF